MASVTTSVQTATRRLARAARPGSIYPDWQAAMADVVGDPADLCRLLDLPPALAVADEQAMGGLPFLVPRTYLARVKRGDPLDPLLLQVLPRRQELDHVPQFTADPVGQHQAASVPGLLSRYRNRALIVTTAGCGVHCRFCFRRHFPFHSLPGSPSEWQPALEQIARDTSINEVILSGGDPLTLDDAPLARLAERLARIPHLRRLRIHTRLPIVIPQRITGQLLRWLRGTRLTTIVAVHVNHPAEIDQPVATALGRLVDGGVPVLSQTVLLRDVNDRTEVLAELFTKLADLRVMPYYLHQLDRVAGAAHFEVPESEGVRLMHELRALLPGYAVPRYVRETPAGLNKLVLA